MKYKALISFSGKVKMSMGEERELTDKEVIKDLLKAGYIIEMKETKPKKKGDKS